MKSSSDRRLYTSVASQIREMIENGHYPPGSRLPSERELAEQLGISRVTIREAQIALQAQGYIEVRPGSGAHVLAPKSEPGALPKVDAFELTQARTVFESEAAALAATLITEDELASLDAIVERMKEDAGPDDPLSADADREFHMAIARASKNAAIVDTIERLWTMRTDLPNVREAYESICEVDPMQRLEEHIAIVRALRTRNSSAARAAMREHFSSIMEAMLQTTEQAAIEAARQRTKESRSRFLDANGLATAKSGA